MRTYKFKMYPTSQEREKLFVTLNNCRFTYNKLLEFMNKQEKVDRGEVQHHIVDLKIEHTFLKNTYSKTLQYEHYRLFSSMKGLSKSKKNGNKIGRLRFKSRNRYTSFTYNQSGYNIIETDKRYNKLHLSKIGDIRFKQSRDIEGKIKQIQIKLKPSGWYCYIVTDGDYECKNIKNNEIGVDLGIMSFMVTSNKEVFDNPLYMNKSLNKIKILSKQLSRTKKGSNNRRKVIHKLLRLWETIDNQKQDYFHKISTKLVKENKLLVFEDLNIKSMTKKTGKNKYRNMKNILDSSWATFVNMLQIKVSSTESEIIFVNPRNTSKMCSSCGNIKTDLQLWDRTYCCKECNLAIDRDYNASINIFRRGKELTFVENLSIGLMNQESMSFRAQQFKKDIKVWEKKHPGVMYTCKVGLPNWLR